MATLTVTAVDTATAMEEIAHKLGDDSFILSTQKRGGKVEIRATNDIQPNYRPRPAGKSKSAFSQALDKANGHLKEVPVIEQDSQSSDNPQSDTSAQQQGEDRKTRTHDLTAVTAEDIVGLETKITRIHSMLDGMFITNRDGLTEEIGRTPYVSLQQDGFSLPVINELKNTFVGLEGEAGREMFLKQLADKLIADAPTEIFEKSCVFVVGPSGSGKSALVGKLAAHVHEVKPGEALEICEMLPVNGQHHTGLGQHARLLNMQTRKLTCEKMLSSLVESDGLTIVDVCVEPEQALMAIRDLQAALGDEKIGVILAMPGGVSPRMIRQQCRLYEKLEPVIAITKLDECETGAEEFSVYAEEAARIAMFTGSQSLIDAIIIATGEALAQYLLEYCRQNN